MAYYWGGREKKKRIAQGCVWIEGSKIQELGPNRVFVRTTKTLKNKIELKIEVNG